MDHFAAKLLSVKEEDIKPLFRVAFSDLHFNPFSSENISVFTSSRNENDDPIPNLTPGNHKTRCYSSSQITTENWKMDSCFPNPVNIITFGNSKLSNSKPVSEICTKSNGHVIKLEGATAAAAEISFSADSVLAPNYVEELYAAVGMELYDEPTKTGGGRTALQSQDHIKAERKRRQKLSESFIALSALVPDLKKLDKATVLDGAIKYLKELQERVNILEENRNTAASACKRTRQRISGDMTASSSDDERSCSQGHSSTAPEIDVKISGENVLLRVYCEKMDGILKEILYEVENLNLSVISTCAMPFGNSNLQIVIIAQMDAGFCMASHEIVENIRDIVLKFM